LGSQHRALSKARAVRRRLLHEKFPAFQKAYRSIRVEGSVIVGAAAGLGTRFRCHGMARQTWHRAVARDRLRGVPEANFGAGAKPRRRDKEEALFRAVPGLGKPTRIPRRKPKLQRSRRSSRKIGPYHERFERKRVKQELNARELILARRTLPRAAASHAIQRGAGASRCPA